MYKSNPCAVTAEVVDIPLHLNGVCLMTEVDLLLSGGW